VGTKPRPKSAFATVGTCARPAGCAGFLGVTDDGSAHWYARQMPPHTGHRHHALRQVSPYAEVVPANWAPREPDVRSSWRVTGAGCISKGSIDNAYMPAPLQNAWGKSRELSKRERRQPPHKQATDLLATAMGMQMPPPTATSIDAVSEPYSITIPLMHPIDPQRLDSGFVRSPNVIPGSKPAPKSPLRTAKSAATYPNEVSDRKFRYERSWMDVSNIPVAKVTTKMTRPSTAQPYHMRKFAGLPGGLALISA